MTIREERESITQHLGQTDAQLELAHETITTYLHLLDDPGRVYRDSEDPIRRALLLAFYTRLNVDRGRVDGTTTEPVRDLQEAAVGYERAKRARSEGPNRLDPPSRVRSAKKPRQICRGFNACYSDRITCLRPEGRWFE